MNNQSIKFSPEIKYLGVTFDKHLRWTPHIKNKCKAATKLLHMCRNYVAEEWGLTPSRSRWIYKQVILPMLSYACFVWIHKVDKTNHIKDMLNKAEATFKCGKKSQIMRYRTCRKWRIVRSCAAEFLNFAVNVR